jgi:1,4-alpha-glucan branching enzyme
MPKGYLALHLHAHLPFVYHPEQPRFLEERWYFDAIVDTYVPLLACFNNLANLNVPYRLSMTLSPTLLAMFRHAQLGERFLAHLSRQEELCAREQERTAGYPEFSPVVGMYRDRLQTVRQYWQDCGGNLANGFAELQREGYLELVTCGVTHGFLPHMQLMPGAVARQLRLAVENHERSLGLPPDGIWLPECAYYPGLEQALLEHGLLYFFVDTHAFQLGMPRSLRGPFSHVYLPNGVAAFARDVASSKQVWSAREGYPGDGVYRDFYRDIGFDLPLDYVAPYIEHEDTRVLTGFKYYAITGDTDEKIPYDPALAQAKVEEHARHFVWCRERQVEWLAERLDRAPIVVAPYDAELFGHWWFEGPDFLFHVLRTAAESPVLRAIAAKDYMLRHQSAQIVTPNTSTWGDGGYNRFWTNQANEWVYPHLAAGARQLEEAAQLSSEQLLQAERELVLAQASDWAFIMATGTSPNYAAGRTTGHLGRLKNLLDYRGAASAPADLADLASRSGWL